jgi:hypothetical protein
VTINPGDAGQKRLPTKFQTWGNRWEQCSTATDYSSNQHQRSTATDYSSNQHQRSKHGPRGRLARLGHSSLTVTLKFTIRLVFVKFLQF